MKRWWWNGVLALGMVVLWFIDIFFFSSVDKVSIYTLDRHVPYTSLRDISGHNSRAEQALVAATDLMDTCVLPEVLTAMLTVPIGTTPTTKPSTLSALTPDQTNNLYDIWGKMDSNAILTDANTLMLPGGQMLPPICKCIYTILEKYKGSTKSMQDANDAINACINNQIHIPQQRLFENGNNQWKNTKMDERKTVSRFMFVLYIGLALIFNWAYQSLDFKERNINWYFYGILFFATMIMFFVPVAGLNNPHNLFTFNSIFMIPGLAFTLLLEIYWYYDTSATSKRNRSQIYMSPFTFYIILASLYTLGLIENGVFTFEVMLSYIFFSLCMQSGYTAVILIYHSELSLKTKESSKGFLLLMSALGLAVAWNAIPTFPFNTEWNGMWAMPVLFCFISFLTVVFHENLAKADYQDATVFDWCMTIFVGILVVYYLRDIQYVGFGSQTMMQEATKNRLPKMMNFELAETGGTPQWAKPDSTAYYMTP